MTQAVHPITQRTLLREAWLASGCRVHQMFDYRHEMRMHLCHRHSQNGNLVVRWPVYLSVTLPEESPPEWRGVIGSRLMAVLLPQLLQSGLFPRPLCVEEPSYLLLLWPLDSVCYSHAQQDIAIPLQDRILPCLFAMLESAYMQTRCCVRQGFNTCVRPWEASRRTAVKH